MYPLIGALRRRQRAAVIGPGGAIPDPAGRYLGSPEGHEGRCRVLVGRTCPQPRRGDVLLERLKALGRLLRDAERRWLLPGDRVKSLDVV